MTADPFDCLARIVAAPGRRRAVVRSLLGLGAVGVAGHGGLTHQPDETEAKNKGKKHGKSKNHKKDKKNKNKSKNKDRCKPDCAGKSCGDDGCGESCGRCATTEICLGGVCATSCDVCASGCLFSNLPLAVNTVAAGSTLILCPETFPGTLIIDRDITLVGAGAGPEETVLDGNRGGTVLVASGSRTITIRNMTITGAATGSNGGVLNLGTLTLDEVRVVGNSAGQFGGGIFNSGVNATLNLVDCVVRGNDASESGGGVFNEEGAVNVIRSQIEGNEASSGGGIFNTGTVTLSGGSTISGNTPDQCVDSAPGTGCP